MSKIKVIVNPQAGRGYAAKAAPSIHDFFSAHGADHDMVLTRAPGDAIALSRQAVEDGFDTVVAVGGDGTSHEVVNGLMAHLNGQPAGTLGCIPAGSGNDFALMNGAPVNILDACQQVLDGNTRLIDVGQVIIDGCITRYFDNVVGIGFDGMVTLETRKTSRLRGMALYLPAVLKTIFFSMKPPRVEILADGEEIALTTLMTVVANGPREGGGFLVVPHAKCDDGALDLMVARTMPKLRMLSMIPRFLKGTHTTDPHISFRKVSQVEIRSPDPLYIHVDGEILCEPAHRIQVRIIPLSLRMIAPMVRTPIHLTTLPN
ncbi:MAG: diacylglycerol/lipid kinase family protein [Anaerolineae bacterium]